MRYIDPIPTYTNGSYTYNGTCDREQDGEGLSIDVIREALEDLRKKPESAPVSPGGGYVSHQGPLGMVQIIFMWVMPQDYEMSYNQCISAIEGLAEYLSSSSTTSTHPFDATISTGPGGTIPVIRVLYDWDKSWPLSEEMRGDNWFVGYLFRARVLTQVVVTTLLQQAKAQALALSQQYPQRVNTGAHWGRISGNTKVSFFTYDDEERYEGADIAWTDVANEIQRALDYMQAMGLWASFTGVIFRLSRRERRLVGISLGPLDHDVGPSQAIWGSSGGNNSSLIVDN